MGRGWSKKTYTQERGMKRRGLYSTDLVEGAEEKKKKGEGVREVPPPVCPRNTTGGWLKNVRVRGSLLICGKKIGVVDTMKAQKREKRQKVSGGKRTREA